MIWNIILAVVILTCIYYMFSRPAKAIPEGLKETPIESGIPLIGVFNKIDGPLHEYLVKVGKKHGPLFRIRFGLRDILILNDYNTIKSALKEKGDILSGRWVPKPFKIMNHDSGLVFKDGEAWYTQKTFILKVLRDFGMGRSRSMEIIHDECISLLEDLETEKGNSIEFSEFAYFHTANIISKFIMNKGFPKHDPNLQLIEKIMKETDKKKDLVMLMYLMYPIFDNSVLAYKLTKPFGYNVKDFGKVHNFFQREIEEHLKVLDFNSEGEDVIDRFLIKQHQLKEKNGEVGSYTTWQLIMNSLELMIGGYETTSSTLVWGMMFLSRHPNVQHEVYREILNEIGNERLPNMNDKKSLHYTQAAMDEILRLSSVVPLSIMHKTLQDINLNGYFIPKNTVVFPNLFAAHTDPNVWKKPFDFYPEHFLIKDSNGDLKYNSSEQLIPFGMGSRLCLGESLARMEYFMFFVCILQKYQVEFAKPMTDQRYEEILRGNEGFIRVSLEGNFIFKKRTDIFPANDM